MSTTTSVESPVGFVGIGAMGLPMAVRLHEAGLPVRAIDYSEPQLEKARARGIQVSSDAQALVDCGVVIIMVTNGDQLRGLINSAPLRSGVLRGATLIVMSTVGPHVVREVEQDAATVGMELIDCPVTGGVAGAEAGTLTLFAAGSELTLHRVKAVLEPMGTVRWCGDRVGDGQSLKLVNQMLATIHLVAAAEAVGFAERLGLNLNKVVEWLPMGAASSWMLADRGPRLIAAKSQRNVSSHLDILVKDSGLVLDAAAALGYEAPLSQASRNKWLEAKAMGLGTDDDSSVIDTYRA